MPHKGNVLNAPDPSARIEPPETVYVFGPFRLHPARRLLMKADLPVPIGSRALEVRAGLVSQARATVAEVYGRFTEGFATADLKAAREFINRPSDG
jgi:hypothetical protein